jgi:hypothetical protein
MTISCDGHQYVLVTHLIAVSRAIGKLYSAEFV